MDLWYLHQSLEGSSFTTKLKPTCRGNCHRMHTYKIIITAEPLRFLHVALTPGMVG